MQELMSKHKTYVNMAPRDCLTSTLFQKFRSNGVMNPQGEKNYKIYKLYTVKIMLELKFIHKKFISPAIKAF